DPSLASRESGAPLSIAWAAKPWRAPSLALPAGRRPRKAPAGFHRLRREPAARRPAHSSTDRALVFDRSSLVEPRLGREVLWQTSPPPAARDHFAWQVPRPALRRFARRYPISVRACRGVRRRPSACPRCDTVTKHWLPAYVCPSAGSAAAPSSARTSPARP